jgi:hypothetical protein
VVLGLIHIVARLAGRVQLEDAMREEEEALRAEKEPNLFQQGEPGGSSSSAGGVTLEEESAPLLV